MIEIIKHGDKSKNEPKEGKCDYCGCEFRYTREDCYWSRPLLTYILACPDCGTDVLVGDVFDE